MRVLLCLNRDLMANLALNQLWPSLRDHTVDIVLSDGVGKAAPKAQEIVRWGRSETRLMEDGLFPFLDGRDPTAGPFRTFAALAAGSETGSVREYPSLNRDDGLAYVRAFAPDVIVSIRFGQIFKAPVIEVPRLGILNLHSGILPKYRGILATFWAMMQRASEIGCTLHTVGDGSIDTGDIVGIHRLPLDRERSVLANVASLYAGGTAMIASALARLSDGRPLETSVQDASERDYFSYPDEAQMAAFSDAGGRLYTAADYRELLRRYDVPDAAAAEMVGLL